MSEEDKDIPLSDRELGLLKDVLDMHIEGCLDGRKLTIETDQSIASVVQLLDAVNVIDEDLAVLYNIREKVTNALQA